METSHKTLSGLYAITDASTRDPKKIILDVEKSLRGGARVIQYRDKSSNQNLRQEVCYALRRLTKKFNATLIINDDIKLALSTKADGVHLGQTDAQLSEARKQLGDNAIIGISCYNRFDLAVQATREGANYIAFGRFFKSHTKPNAVTAETYLLQRAHQELDIPIIAIGGITVENGKALIKAGAHMLAVVDGLYGQQNIEAAASKFCSLFD